MSTNPAAASLSLYSFSSRAPPRQAIHNSIFRRHYWRDVAAHDDVRDSETAAGLENAECLAKHGVFCPSIG